MSRHLNILNGQPQRLLTHILIQPWPLFHEVIINGSPLCSIIALFNREADRLDISPQCFFLFNEHSLRSGDSIEYIYCILRRLFTVRVYIDRLTTVIIGVSELLNKGKQTSPGVCVQQTARTIYTYFPTGTTFTIPTQYTSTLTQYQLIEHTNLNYTAYQLIRGLYNTMIMTLFRRHNEVFRRQVLRICLISIFR